jgi:hypothetical protein
MSYSYGGSNINFDTNPKYPIISVKIDIYRKDPYTVSSNFYHYNASSASSKPSSSKKK